MKSSLFVKISGKPILDFVNTWVQHASETEDRLSTRQLAKTFFLEVFGSKLTVSPADFRLILSRRKDIRKLLNAFLDTRQPTNLNSIWPFNKSMKINLALSPTNRIALQLKNPIESILLLQTMDFLANFDPERLKKCRNDNCSHFFYDTSKASMRHWCSMKSCGNLAKVRNFRKRIR
jgi:predicted RNA-binding Zn ribbon-like protein